MSNVGRRLLSTLVSGHPPLRPGSGWAGSAPGAAALSVLSAPELPHHSPGPWEDSVGRSHGLQGSPGGSSLGARNLRTQTPRDL